MKTFFIVLFLFWLGSKIWKLIGEAAAMPYEDLTLYEEDQGLFDDD